RALREIRRIVRPGGVVLVLTNSERHFKELDELLIECAAATIGASRVHDRTSLTRFKIEDGGEELEAVFAEVTLYPFESELVLDIAAPVVAYAESMGTFVIDRSGDGELDAVVTELEQQLATKIEADVAFRITTACGCFVCR